jgi:galactosylxylosylprotein 3-beta-galactosyltransferase
MSWLLRLMLLRYTMPLRRLLRSRLFLLLLLLLLLLFFVFLWWQNNQTLHLDQRSSPKDIQAFLTFLILTGPKYYDRRNTIRETWLSNLPSDVKAYFVIGTATLLPEELGTLEYENSLHEDLILLRDFYDSYFNLTAKVLKSFEWVDRNVETKFVFKGDDDSFVNVDRLYQELTRIQCDNLYWGFFDGRANVKKTGQWAEKDWVVCDHYLPHARGGGYVLASKLVSFIAQNSQLLKRYNSEDVSVGAWLAPLDVKRFHDFRFDTEFVSRGCSNKYLVTHKQDVNMMKEKHENLKRVGHLCTQEVRTRNSFIYNWGVPPSSCCDRKLSDLDYDIANTW